MSGCIHAAPLRSSSTPRCPMAHIVVWDRFHGSSNPVERRIGDRGRRLRKRRGSADYDDRFTNLANVVSDTIGMTRRLLADLASLP